ncbi:MAG: deoxyribose-phosphate aldolase [Elusimicrobia bacterium]|nr:deoxyribose-phosphate aldolase [Elusimicrobiota bacterium]
MNEHLASLEKTLKRNPIHAFDPHILSQLHLDATGIAGRTDKIAKTRTPKKEYQAAWLKAAVTMIDLTTLEGADTPGRLQRIIRKAIRPIPNDAEVQVAAVCVYGNLVSQAKKLLDGSPIKVAAVSTSFPHGQTPLQLKVEETKTLVNLGADEIDMVVSRNALLSGDYYRVYEEIAEIREACGETHLKVILETGELGSLSEVWIASEIAMQAGADFIKTSTGKIPSAATPQVGLVMLHAIDSFHKRTGYQIGLKPAGGLRLAKQSLFWLAMVKETVGDEWLTSQLFRIGASSLLDDIVRQLHHFETGQYESYDYVPKG